MCAISARYLREANASAIENACRWVRRAQKYTLKLINQRLRPFELVISVVRSGPAKGDIQVRRRRGKRFSYANATVRERRPGAR